MQILKSTYLVLFVAVWDQRHSHLSVICLLKNCAAKSSKEGELFQKRHFLSTINEEKIALLINGIIYMNISQARLNFPLKQSWCHSLLSFKMVRFSRINKLTLKFLSHLATLVCLKKTLINPKSNHYPIFVTVRHISLFRLSHYLN